MRTRGVVIGVILLIFAISMIEPVLAVPFVDKAVICADKPKGYDDYTAHYQFKGYSSEPYFPPGSTVYIYVEATGKAVENSKTGQFEPNIKFEMEGERLETGGTFSASTSSDKRVSDEVKEYKKTYGVISYKIDNDAISGKYRIKIVAKDKNDGNKIVAMGPYLSFYVQKNASLFPSYKYEYKNLNITPNPAEFGQTVTVSVNVTNQGGKGDLKGKDVVVFYNGKKLTSNLHLNDGETKKLEFKLSENELTKVGTFSIVIGDLKDTLVVNEKNETTPPPHSEPHGERRRVIPGFEAIYAILGVFVVFYLMIQKNDW